MTLFESSSTGVVVQMVVLPDVVEAVELVIADHDEGVALVRSRRLRESGGPSWVAHCFDLVLCQGQEPNL